MTAAVAPSGGTATGNGSGMLTRDQARKITTFLIGNYDPNMGRGVQDYPRLQQTLGVHTRAQAQGIAAEALRMTGHSDQQIKRLLAIPDGHITIQQIIDQALIGLGVAGGVALAGGGAGAATDAAAADAAAGGSAGGAAGGAAGGGAAGTAKKALSAVAGNAKTVAAGLTGATLAGMFTDVGWWKGAGMILAGVILIVLALRMLT